MRRISVAWLPGLLIGLLLGAAILTGPLGETPPAATSTASPVAPPPSGVDHHSSGAHGSVVAQLAAQPEGVRLCASASLEPLDGAIEQLRRDGPGEATERMRRCLADTTFDHAPAAILVELEAHTPYLKECFQAIDVEPGTTKSQLVEQLVQCLSDAYILPQ